MTKNKITKISLLIITTLFYWLPQNVLASFNDVTESHPYYEAITSLEEKGLVKGYDNNLFRPEKIVTRAEYLKLVFNHVGYKPENTVNTTPFTDVPAESWFAPYVKKAFELGLIRFDANLPKFSPSHRVNRIEGLKALFPLEGIPMPFTADTSSIIFEDVSPFSPDRYVILAAQNSGVFIPEDEPFFQANRNLTRGEVAYLLQLAEMYKEGKGITTIVPQESTPASYLNESESELFNSPQFPIFLSVWGKLNTEYIDKNDISQNQLVYGAIDGMVDSLDDPYTIFEEPATSQDVQDTLTGNYEGIGTVLDIFDEQLIILSVMQDSPAEKAGIKAGDIVTKIDNTEAAGLNIQELISLIKGPAGTEVKLTIDRNGKEMIFDIERAKITLTTVLMQGDVDIPSTIGYISIHQFTDSTSSEFDSIITDTLAQNPEGLILDLRNNPGGYVNSAYDVLDFFVPKGESIVKMNIYDEYLDEFSNGPGNITEEIPLVVLVNENTASAAEIVAGALQDYEIATIIGEQTFGKGTVQEVNIYNDGSLFKLSIAEWFTPLKRTVDKVGITPDIIVKKTKDDALGKTDSQLERAIKELQ